VAVRARVRGRQSPPGAIRQWPDEHTHLIGDRKVLLDPRTCSVHARRVGAAVAQSLADGATAALRSKGPVSREKLSPISAGTGQPVPAGQHHRGKDACIIDRSPSPRWDWHMREARLTLRAYLRAGGPVGVVR